MGCLVNHDGVIIPFDDAFACNGARPLADREFPVVSTRARTQPQAQRRARKPMGVYDKYASSPVPNGGHLANRVIIPAACNSEVNMLNSKAVEGSPSEKGILDIIHLTLAHPLSELTQTELWFVEF